MRALSFLALAVISAQASDERSVNGSANGPMQKWNGTLPFTREFWAAIVEKITLANFRFLLEVASNLVGVLFSEKHLPRVPERSWGEKQNNSIRPFKVQFSDKMITDLRARIHNRRNITRSLLGAVHTYGTNSEYLNYFVDYWANDYDFKKREEWLNKFPQFMTNVQGLDIHYIHMKPSNPHSKKVLPLMLLHGWPLSAFEYVHVIGHLLQDREECDFVFEVIVPDLPGFGYSQGASEIGMSQYQMAVIMKNLMRRLGKPKFYVHAGDIGQPVADALAVLYPDIVMGLHTNFPYSIRPQTLTKYVLGQLYPSAVEPRYQSRMYPLIDTVRFLLENFGYFHLQASRPDNVGHGLEDSPVAHASWLISNIIVATAPINLLTTDGNLPKSYDMLDWFDSFTVYWAAQCMGTSVRLYAEILAWFQDPLTYTILTTPTPVPFAAIRFRHELIYMPDDFLRDKYPNLLQATTLDYGGHFAGYEKPAVLADSIWMAVKKMEAFNAKKNVTIDLLV